MLINISAVLMCGVYCRVGFFFFLSVLVLIAFSKSPFPPHLTKLVSQ